MNRVLETPDPLAVALEPPPNETPSERWAREQAEAQARRISDQIDSEIKAEKMAMKKRKPPIKVLLLGQSESGKSTTVKSECISTQSPPQSPDPAPARLPARIRQILVPSRAGGMARRHPPQPRPLRDFYYEHAREGVPLERAAAASH